MTLDVPTGPVRSPGYKYQTTQDCLKETLYNLEYFRDNRKATNVKFLNVLQGNTTQETDKWFNAVKGFDFEGWAFAGVLRHNFFNLCRRVIQMADQCPGSAPVGQNLRLRNGGFLGHRSH
jgi:hypothetical protein